MLFILVEFVAPQETIVICELQLKSPLKRSKGGSAILRSATESSN